MVINYKQLIGREFADVIALLGIEERRISLGIAKRVQRLDPERTTYVDLTKVSDRDSIDSCLEVNMGGALSCMLSVTGYDALGYDPVLCGYFKNEIGRAIAIKLGEKVIRLSNDSIVSEIINWARFI